MNRDVDGRQKKTIEMDAILYRAMNARGRAWIKCCYPGKGFGFVKRFGPGGVAKAKTKIRRMLHEFWFFEPNTQSEVDALRAAKHFCKRRPWAVLSVSEPCVGVCRELPVIAPYPFGDKTPEVELTRREAEALWKVWRGLTIEDDDGEDLDELGLAAKGPSGEWMLRFAGEEKVRELWGAEVAA